MFIILNIFSNAFNPGPVLSVFEKKTDQDPHCFSHRLKIYAYNWNAADKQDKNWGVKNLKYSA